MWPDELWRALEEGGLTLPLVAEDQGGARRHVGGRPRGGRAAGRHAVPAAAGRDHRGRWLLRRRRSRRADGAADARARAARRRLAWSGPAAAGA